MQAGAIGYLRKNALLEEVLEAIRRMAAGERHIEFDTA